jgi:hypothetical protein
MKHCIAILNKQKCYLFFTKTENRKVKQVLSGRWVLVGGGRYKGRETEGEYGGNVMYTYK